MSLATATLDTFATVTAALTPITETPVVRDSTAQEWREHHDDYTFMLYVTRVSSTDPRMQSTVGTVVKVAPSSNSDGWIYRHTNGLHYRVYGAVLNEPMVNGGHYRALGGHGMLVRYNDDEHTSDRHIPALALSILAVNGAPWPIPNDGTGADWADVPYIQVEEPAPSTPPAEELVDAQQFLTDLTSSGPARGFAALNEAGRAALNPALEVGEMYIYWSTNVPWEEGRMSEARMVTALPEGGDPAFAHVGYWTMERVGGQRQPYWYSSRRSVLDSEEPKAWVKLALSDPEPTDTDASHLTAAMGTEAEAFREFNEATNELAKDKDWCSEYEGIIEPLGMEGRTKTMHDYDVEVAATISFEADSVSSRIDGHVATDYNIPGISLNSARFRGDVTVTIRVSDVDDDDDASDQIDSDAVYEHINDMMSGIDDLEIDDWSVGTTRQVD